MGDEFTLRNFMNVVVTSITSESKEGEAGGDTLITGTLNKDGTFKTTELKATWVPDTPSAVPVVLHDFDYLVTKDKILEDDNFEDFVNEVTEAVTVASGDPNIRRLQKGTSWCSMMFNDVTHPTCVLLSSVN